MNIFHCCVQKTASQWIRRILNDPRVLECCEMQTYNFYKDLDQEDPRLSKSYTFREPFPTNTIVTPLYVNFESFCTIPKSNDYRGFFVTRDPRDLVVSWYFSTKYSHRPIGQIQERRDQLNQVSLQEGLMTVIDQFDEDGYFASLQSWLHAPEIDPKIVLVKYEDLTTADQLSAFKALFQHCEIPIHTDVIQAVLDDIRFEKLAQRKQGIEDVFSHYRKGIEGDWVNYFDAEVEEKFNTRAGDLTMALGYRSTQVDLLKKQLAQAQLYLQQAHIGASDASQEESGGKGPLIPPLLTLPSREKIELSQAIAKLNQSQANLLRANQRAKKLRTQLQRTKRQLANAQKTITIMESNRLWWLQSVWSKLKKLVLPSSHSGLDSGQ